MKSFQELILSLSEFWAGQGKPFFAVLLDPQRRSKLPDLFNGA